jgi:general nucleoside transport system permease protein
VSHIDAFGTVMISLVGGAIRVSTPYLFVSLGECITETSGRINLGQEGILVLGAMVGYAISFKTGNPWAGVICAGLAGSMLGALHALACSLPRVNDIAIGIAVILFGTGMAFLIGKPFIQPVAPMLPALELGWWSNSEAIRSALRVNALFFVGVALTFALRWGFSGLRWGMVLRTVGDSADAAKALGFSVLYVRFVATVVGAFFSGVGGAFLSLYYPGSWTESLSGGQGLMAVALVIFARWDPLRCLWTSLLFGAAGALGPALQAVGFGQVYYLVSAMPYALTLGILIASSSRERRAAGAPRELRAV